MAEENPQIDLKPIEKSLGELDKKLAGMNQIFNNSRRSISKK